MKTLYSLTAAFLLAVGLAVAGEATESSDVDPASSDVAISLALTSDPDPCDAGTMLACTEAQKEDVRQNVIKPKCGDEGGWACVGCTPSEIYLVSVTCGPPPDEPPDRCGQS